MVARTGEQPRRQQARQQQQRSEVRRERIFDAALEVFSRRGYRDAAMDEIAAESDTSKGGLYFHFPNKQSLFLGLLDRMSALLLDRVVDALAAEPDPLRRIDVALHVVLETFGSHRRLARLFLIDALGAGREFNARMLELHRAFAELIATHLDEAVSRDAIAPLDTEVAGMAWFGALNEVVTRWVLSDQAPPLQTHEDALRQLLRRSVGAPSGEPVSCAKDANELGAGS